MREYRKVAGAAAADPVFRFEADRRAAEWVLIDAYCDDPVCEGPEGDMVLVAVADSTRRIEFGFDFIEGRAYWEPDLPALDKAIVGEFMGNARVPRLLDRRRSLVRAWGIMRSEGATAVPTERRCYGLEDFDRNGDPHAIPFQSGGQRWCAFDLYCVDPSCGCEMVVLSLARDRAKATTLRAAFAARIDLRGTGAEATSESGAPLSPRERRIVDDLLEELGDWSAELRIRRSFVREIASVRLTGWEAAAAPPPAPLPAPPEAGAPPGRNDGCPCGSGRKFKKCCGRRSGSAGAAPALG